MNYTDKGKNVWATHETIEIINCFLSAPLMLLSITGNSLALAAILRTPSIRSTSMILLCSLADSDILVGVIVQPLLIADTLKSLTTQDPLLNSVSAMTGFFVVGVSLATMTAISVDRFVALHCHLRYATIVTERRAMFTVGIIWLIMFLSLGLYLGKASVSPNLQHFYWHLSYNLYIFLHWYLSNCSQASVTDSR